MTPHKKICFHTLGCKLNFSETSYISKLLDEEAYLKVAFLDKPDIYVFNTCAVTKNAVKECHYLIRKALKHNAEAIIAVVGCYAQLNAQEIASIEGVDLVLGTTEKFDLPKYIHEIESKKNEKLLKVHVGEINDTKIFTPTFSLGERTRSFLKIQDGCDYFCSFCTIPLARGRSRSQTVDETIRVAKELAQTNVKEVVLTGVNIGDFGRVLSDSNKGFRQGEENFYDLVKELDKIEGIERYRISSIEPNLLSDEMLEFIVTSKRFTPHFHIPLQSGSDKILKAMRRKYDTKQYALRIEKIKQLMPNACIGIDVIVGFPGEEDEDFQQTYHYLEQLPFSYLHVFSYSERDKTLASKLEQQVDSSTKKIRSNMLHLLSDKKRRAFYEENKGHQAMVLFESKNDDGWMYGFTENYIKVRTPFTPSLINQILLVKLEEIDKEGLFLLEIS